MTAILSVYDKTGLIDLAQGLHKAGISLLGSGGTAKKIRDAGIPIQFELFQKFLHIHAFSSPATEMFLTSRKRPRC